MSGNSGGSGYSASDNDNCETLSITTSLASPVPAVIEVLQPGDVLNIVLQGSAGPVLAVTEQGAIAGAIMPSALATLVQCISDGHRYIGKVLSIVGGNCRLLIVHL